MRHLALGFASVAAVLAVWPRSAPAIAEAPQNPPPAEPSAPPLVRAEALEEEPEAVAPPPAPSGPLEPAPQDPPPSPSRGSAHPLRPRPPRAPTPTPTPTKVPAPAPAPLESLRRALEDRGLSEADLATMPEASAELARFLRVPSAEALPELLGVVDAAEIPTALLRAKLDRLADTLRRRAKDLPPGRLEEAERAYLDQETTLSHGPSRVERHQILRAVARWSRRLEDR
ncbi:MAG: hypothetical protein U1E65_24490 [Myxococcota bacterium]